MKKLIYLLPFVLLACAPGKKETPIYYDIYCDSCSVKISNEWSEGQNPNKTVVKEVVFDGVVDNYKRIEFYRFDSPNSCTRPVSFQNFSTDTCWIYIIENSDTIGVIDNGGNGYCY